MRFEMSDQVMTLHEAKGRVKGLPDRRPAGERLLGQIPVGFEDHLDGFLQILSGFFQGVALRIGAGQLLGRIR